MKNIITLIFTLILTLALVSCNTSDDISNHISDSYITEDSIDIADDYVVDESDNAESETYLESVSVTEVAITDAEADITNEISREEYPEPVVSKLDGRTITMEYYNITSYKVDPSKLGDIKYGYAPVVLNKKGPSFAFISPDGEILNDKLYEFAYNFGDDGLALVQIEDGSWRYITKKGADVGEAPAPKVNAYDTEAFYETNGVYGLLNGRGEKITEPIFLSMTDFEDGSGFGSILLKDGDSFAFGYVNRKGKIIKIPEPIHNSFIENDRIFCKFQSEGEWMVYDLNGNETLSKRYSVLCNCDGLYYAVIEDGKLGLIDTDGNVLVPPSLPCDYSPDMIIGYGAGYLTVALDGKLAFVKISEELHTPEEDIIKPIRTYTETGMYNGKTVTMEMIVTGVNYPRSNFQPQYTENGYDWIDYWGKAGEEADSDFKFALVDKDGNVYAKHLFDSVHDFDQNGYAVVYKAINSDVQHDLMSGTRDSYGYIKYIIDTKGNAVSSIDDYPEYNFNKDYKKSDNKIYSLEAGDIKEHGFTNYNIVDRNGNVVFTFEGIIPSVSITESNTVKCLSTSYIVGSKEKSEQGVSYICDVKGNILSPLVDNIGEFENGIAVFLLDDKIGLMSDTGEVIIPATIPGTGKFKMAAPWPLSQNNGIVYVRTPDGLLSMVKITIEE